MSDRRVGVKINNQIYLKRNDTKSWREQPWVVITFFVSIVLQYYFVFLGYVNVLSINVNSLIGFNNYYVNYILSYLLFCGVVFIVYFFVFKLLCMLIVGVSFSLLFNSKRIKKYLYFWFGVRNILIAIFYVLCLIVPFLTNFIFMFNMFVTLSCFVLIYIDVKNYVLGDILSTFTYNRLSKFLITYYAVLAVVNYWSFGL